MDITSTLIISHKPSVTVEFMVAIIANNFLTDAKFMAYQPCAVCDIHVKPGWNWHYILLLGLPKCIKMLPEPVWTFRNLKGVFYSLFFLPLGSPHC